MDKNQIRILLVDDHEMVRKGLGLFISGFDDLALVGEAENGDAALQLCASVRPDLAIVDLLMPKPDGIATIKAIRQHFPNVRIVAMTSLRDEALVRSAINAGALGFVYKDVGVQELAYALRQVHAGKPALAPDAVKALMNSINHGTAADTVTLSDRERQILNLVADGFTNQQIANQLYVSVGTVKQYISTILSKLGAASRTEAVKLAVQQRLIELE